jgi:hypothetical protein
MAKVKLAKLTLDWRIYPRHNVDECQVRRLKTAISQGEKLPPILVDRKSLRIVDGFHRYYAAKGVLGEGGEIEAELRDFASEAEMIIESATLNSRHGTPMDTMDQAATLIRALQLGVTMEQVAVALAVSTEKLVTIQQQRLARGPDGPEIVKRSTLRWAGKKLTRAQVEMNNRFGGMNSTYYINRVVDLIRGNLLDLDDERVVEALVRLREALKELAQAA